MIPMTPVQTCVQLQVAYALVTEEPVSSLPIGEIVLKGNSGKLGGS